MRAWGGGLAGRRRGALRGSGPGGNMRRMGWQRGRAWYKGRRWQPCRQVGEAAMVCARRCEHQGYPLSPRCPLAPHPPLPGAQCGPGKGGEPVWGGMVCCLFPSLPLLRLCVCCRCNNCCCQGLAFTPGEDGPLHSHNSLAPETPIKRGRSGRLMKGQYCVPTVCTSAVLRAGWVGGTKGLTQKGLQKKGFCPWQRTQR